jgi:HEAT repeat protein
MSTKHFVSKLSVLALACVPFTVSADGATEFVVYDRERGELSPGTEAPTSASMMAAIDEASPQGLTAMLEYGERVECLACIPKLQSKLLDSDSAATREIAAWWLRRRPFGYARAAVAMRQTLESDRDDVRRARAAEALGEFLDAGGVPALEQAVLEDGAPGVRLAAVRALGRMNARAGHAVIAAAFEDEDASIRRAALDQVLRVSFFSECPAVIPKLEDSSADVRIRAAQIIGQLQLQAGREALEAVLADDESVPVRQAAAWALGKLGGARQALIAAQESESEPRVLDAVRVALSMAR